MNEKYLYLICARCGRRELFSAATLEEAVRQAVEAGWRWDICMACAAWERDSFAAWPADG